MLEKKVRKIILEKSSSSFPFAQSVEPRKITIVNIIIINCFLFCFFVDLKSSSALERSMKKIRNDQSLVVF